jgi:hypothetical protein
MLSILPDTTPGKVWLQDSPRAHRRDVAISYEQDDGGVFERVEPGEQPICSDKALEKLAALIGERL